MPSKTHELHIYTTGKANSFCEHFFLTVTGNTSFASKLRVQFLWTRNHLEKSLTKSAHPFAAPACV